MNNGFIQIPRSLLADSLWINLSSKCQIIFIQILSRVCFRPQKFNDHGKIIDLKAGEICTTIREIMGWFNDEFSKNDIERCVKKLILCDFLRQEVRHIKSVISILYRDTYDLILTSIETGKETELRQDRDKIETQKNTGNTTTSIDVVKKDRARTAKRPRSIDALSFDHQKWEFTGITERDIADWKIMYPHIDIEVETLKAAQWFKNNQSKSNRTSYRRYITGWFGRENERIENKKAYRSSAGGSTQDRSTKDINGNPVANPYAGKF